MFLVALAAWAVCAPTWGHGLDANLAVFRLDGATLRMELTPTIDVFAAFNDNHDDKFDASEIAAHRVALRAFMHGNVVVVDEHGRQGTTGLFDVVVPQGAGAPGDGSGHVSVRWHQQFEQPPQHLFVEMKMLRDDDVWQVVGARGVDAQPGVQRPRPEREQQQLLQTHPRVVLFGGDDVGVAQWPPPPSTPVVAWAPWATAIAVFAAMWMLFLGRRHRLSRPQP